mmetsp:Transcript_5673/g.13326  ORF Transcript_5673/g.13326 Transcript_5673/m.13326 type:complete len:284 (-) Transcript_5673:173-1024(-)|eukprot:CAMPEP_0206458070 /NCGR_PEP_ID=MMETSP0324_2-20121206/23342_1 /ASSEMBLY_ACC=CAM_ASM_000836 /TAXON_ID=2866 /ORGANISM="Crypthecodinium cohnii, Strain Seligo" /LENGTH=283 /DNA_ID=CAMNT_0053929321 /DNA_START=231 /DNA_END=1082 /DNA_ORIENTATION=+
MADSEARERSRSPARTGGGGEGGATSSAAIPDHWKKAGPSPAGAATGPTTATAAPTPEAAAAAAATSGKAGGKGKGKAGKRAALLTGTIGEDAVMEEGEEPVNAATLLALSKSIEDGKVPSNEELAKILKRASTKMGTLEKAVGELGQAMRAISTMSGQTLAAAGLLSADNLSAMPMMEDSAEGKSYMIRKADEDLAEAHRAAAAARPSTSSSHGPSEATLSSGGAAKSKEEMDAARRARLERLEAQQADKIRERESADAKSRAREALFEKPYMTKGNLLGKH